MFYKELFISDPDTSFDAGTHSEPDPDTILTNW